MSLAEPVTVLTNCLLAATSALLGLSLLRSRDSSLARLLWGIGFLTGAASAVFGAVFHGSAALWSPETRSPIWNMTVVLIGVTLGLMFAAGLASGFTRHGRNTRWLVASGVLSLVGFLIQQTGFSLSSYFNHNDLYHCIQTIALVPLFKCASLTR